VLLIGVQGSGKNTFFRRRFFETHVRVSRDMLRTRRRERLLVAACFAKGQPCVVDNTNALASRRAEHIAPAKAAGFRVIGFIFRCDLREALARNRRRPAQLVVPPAGVAVTFKKLQPPPGPRASTSFTSSRSLVPANFSCGNGTGARKSRPEREGDRRIRQG
jgi:predicted kinase